MAWIDNLLDASFRGITFEIVKADDSADRALVEHAYPYVDGADVEDLGRGARHVSVEAVFYGDDYEEQLQAFLEALDGKDDQLNEEDARLGGYLVHPVFGTMFVQVGRHAVHHDAENVDQASVTVEFVESTPSAPFFARSLTRPQVDAIAQHGATAAASASEAAGKVIDSLRAANPLASLDTLRTAMTGPLLAVGETVSLTLSGLDVLAYPRAWGNDISALVGSVLDVREWGDRVAADWESVQSDLNAFSIFSTPPAASETEAGVAPTETQGVAAVAAAIQVNVAAGLGESASLVLAGEAEKPQLMPEEVERISNTVRSAINAAIEQVRAIYGIDRSRGITEALKNQALAIQEAALAINAMRPSVVRRTVEVPGNMRLLAHLWYGNHARATQLYRLNQARRPFVMPGDTLNAYAR